MHDFHLWKAAWQTSLRRLLHQSDYGRWRGEDGLSRSWDSRTEQMAVLIQPGASVIDFGAGRMVLKDMLPQGCRYTPLDLVDRGYGTIICDLNARTLPTLSAHFDVAVLSGVIEYVHNVRRLAAFLSSLADSVIASYATQELNSNKVQRRASGWVNDLTSEELQAIFLAVGLRCDHGETWRLQQIYRFVKASPNRP